MIENNKIKAGEKLPSEFDLQNKYQASRDTIRKALLLLSQNGYIQKSQGKSSIVLDINRFNFPVSVLTSFKEIASDIKGKVETIVHTCECIEPDEEIKKFRAVPFGAALCLSINLVVGGFIGFRIYASLVQTRQREAPEGLF